MNDPIDHDGNLETRLEKLEQNLNHLLRQAKTHELDLNQVKAALERVLFDTGSTRESLDSLERRYAEAIKRLRAIAETQASHSERLDTLARGQQEATEKLKQELETHSKAWLEALQENFTQVKEALVEIRTTQGTRNERFDRMETRLESTATRHDVSRIET